MEACIAEIHRAYAQGEVSCREVVESYLNRIAAYDSCGPAINCIITLDPEATKEADRLDAQYRSGGSLGPLHGIPVIVKDQIDVAGMPTTLGSVMFKDYHPEQDASVVTKLRSAGALVLAKSTLGELGGGDTHGTLFGSTRNPYDLERTAGGSSGGSAAAVTANFAPVALGLEGFASIRRPAAWNSIVGMRPTLGLVSRTGCFSGWPSASSSVGPMARTVEDAARLLDVIVGDDPADPSTASGAGRWPRAYAGLLRADSLQGARVGVIREPIGYDSDPGAEDYAGLDRIFSDAVGQIRDAGAVIVDPLALPGIRALLDARRSSDGEESFNVWMKRSGEEPFMSYAQLTGAPLYEEIMARRYGANWGTRVSRAPSDEFRTARKQMRRLVLAAMDENQLDIIVHRSVEHDPSYIRDGINPPYVNQKGAPFINTMIGDVPAVSVPSAFTPAGLPTGITFIGRPFGDAALLGYAFAYEQATRHRRPPAATPPLN